MFHKLLVRSFFFPFLFPSLLFLPNLAIPYYSDHHTEILSNHGKVLPHSQFHSASSGMWALAPSALKRVEYYVLPPLGNATDSHTAPTEIAKSNSNNVYLQTNPLSPCPQSISPSHFSGDHWHTRHNIKHLEQLLDSSLATVAVIQSSGKTLADVLTPHAYDTFTALYALAELDAPASSTKTKESEIPTRSTFSDIGNDCPYSSNRSPPVGPLPNSSLTVPRTGTNQIYISISLDHVILFSWAGLVTVSYSVLLLMMC